MGAYDEVLKTSSTVQLHYHEEGMDDIDSDHLKVCGGTRVWFSSHCRHWPCYTLVYITLPPATLLGILLYSHMRILFASRLIAALYRILLSVTAVLLVYMRFNLLLLLALLPRPHPAIYLSICTLFPRLAGPAAPPRRCARSPLRCPRHDHVRA